LTQGPSKMLSESILLGPLRWSWAYCKAVQWSSILIHRHEQRRSSKCYWNL